jgi:hypothetical protein
VGKEGMSSGKGFGVGNVQSHCCQSARAVQRSQDIL